VRAEPESTAVSGSSTSRHIPLIRGILGPGRLGGQIARDTPALIEEMALLCLGQNPYPASSRRRC